MVLAVNASQVASCKEDIAYPCRSADGRFLSPVYADGCNIESGIGTAVSVSPPEPVHTALPWAKSAMGKQNMIRFIVIIEHQGQK